MICLVLLINPVAEVLLQTSEFVLNSEVKLAVINDRQLSFELQYLDIVSEIVYDIKGIKNTLLGKKKKSFLLQSANH